MFGAILLAELNAKKAKQDALRIKYEGEAKAEANRALVLAGLTPTEKAEYEYKTKVGVAEALAKTVWPKIVMSGNGNGGSTAMDVIALKQMTDMVDKISK